MKKPEIRAVFNPFGLFVGLFVPNFVAQNRKLSSTTKLVYGRLTQYAGRNGEAFPKLSTLAEEVGMSERSVRESIAELAAEGFIRIVKPQGKERLLHAPDRYLFLWHETFDDAFSDRNQNAARTAAGFRSGVRPAAGPKEESQPEENRVKNSIPPLPPEASAFLPDADGGGNEPPPPTQIDYDESDSQKAPEVNRARTDATTRKPGPSSARVHNGFKPEFAILPPKLDTPRFRQAWAEWCQHRTEIRVKLTPLAVKKQLLQLCEWGEARAVKAIDLSINREWKGIHEAFDNGNNSSGANPGGGQLRVTDGFLGTDGQWNDRHTAEEIAAIMDQPDVPEFPFVNTPRTPPPTEEPT